MSSPYLRSALSSFLACVAIYLSATLYQADWGQPPLDYLHEMYAIKTAAADRAIATDTPKLVLVSGSNSHYGIRCVTIVERTGIPCVNGGIHAGIGIDYLLDRARRDWLRPGDIALMPLEFNHYIDRGIPSKFFIHYVLRYDRGYLNRRGALDRLRFWFGLPITRVWKRTTGKLLDRPVSTDGPDPKNEVGRYGDRLNNEPSDRNEIQAGYVADAEPLPVLMAQSFTGDSPGARSIRRFVRWCRDRDITPIATWPNALWFDDYADEHPQAFFAAIEQFYAELDVPLIGEPRQMMPADRDLFFDSDYHLNREGVDRHTDLILKLLAPYLPARQSVLQPSPN
ncbi:MAG: hypothetical protein ACFB9N_17070 [Geitlerinemataceae cyanobacterium]